MDASPIDIPAERGWFRFGAALSCWLEVGHVVDKAKVELETVHAHCSDNSIREVMIGHSIPAADPTPYPAPRKIGAMLAVEDDVRPSGTRATQLAV